MLAGLGIALAVVLALDGGSVVELLLVLLLFGAITLRWVLYSRGWVGLWRR